LAIELVKAMLLYYNQIAMTEYEKAELDVEKIASFWLLEAEEALQVADHLIAKADYSYALFFGHLAVEKMLKAVFVTKQKQHAPPLHNLLRLARSAGLEVNQETVDKLVTITAFNIEARYPDFKRSFRQRCTAEYTAEQMAIIRELMQWLKSQMPSGAVSNDF
jgi:HEPN domain-containing protein